jgi:hypothetical protein
MPSVPYHRSIGLLSAVMLAALMGVVTGAFQRFNPTWQPDWLIGMCFLIALEANLIHRLTRRERMSLGERLRFLAPELLVLIILMRLIASLSLPGPGLMMLAERWLYDPVSVIEPFFVLYVVIGIIIGVLAHSAAGDIAMLGLFAGDTQAYRHDGGERFAAVLSTERTEALYDWWDPADCCIEPRSGEYQQPEWPTHSNLAAEYGSGPDLYHCWISGAEPCPPGRAAITLGFGRGNGSAQCCPPMGNWRISGGWWCVGDCCITPTKLWHGAARCDA